MAKYTLITSLHRFGSRIPAMTRLKTSWRRCLEHPSFFMVNTCPLSRWCSHYMTLSKTPSVPWRVLPTKSRRLGEFYLQKLQNNHRQFFFRYGSFKILIDLYFRAPKGSNLEKVKFWHDKLIFFLFSEFNISGHLTQGHRSWNGSKRAKSWNDTLNAIWIEMARFDG